MSTKRRGMDNMSMTGSRRLAGLGQEFWDTYPSTYDYVSPSYELPNLLPDYTGSAGFNMPSLTEIVNAAKSAAGAYLTYQQASNIQDINLQRVRQGLPVLTPAQMSSLSPMVNVGLSPDMRNLLLIGGGGLLLLMLMRPSGRRH